MLKIHGFTVQDGEKYPILWNIPSNFFMIQQRPNVTLKMVLNNHSEVVDSRAKVFKVYTDNSNFIYIFHSMILRGLINDNLNNVKALCSEDFDDLCYIIGSESEYDELKQLIEE